ncbi:MAG: Rpn family recombination-promoting nuclease/putative transposase [Rhodocyclaceae bacterium]|nr:Rpn family recombination-promoting nuclease/putative transposase [Rhodocyclaceae bacterium]
MPTPYDGLYKLLFSHTPMVQALLRGFVHEDWVAHLDFSTLEKPNGHYVSEALQQRSDDILWRMRLNLPDGRSEWLYLYLLIEFQSRSDPWMALRLLTYVCMLYQDLIKSGEVAPGAPLPPVFPLVLYNGLPRWQATQEVADLIAAPGDLGRWRPRFRYHLLDEGRVPAEELGRLSNNLLALLIRLETTPDAPAIREATAALVQHLKGPAYDSLRRAFVAFYNRAILTRLNSRHTIREFRELQEGGTMIAERIDEWGKQIHQKALQEGLQEGRRDEAARMLRRLLALRFGELPDWAEARLAGATQEALETWIDAVLTAESLEGVIGRP